MWLRSAFSAPFLFSRWLLVLCLTLVPFALFVENTFIYLLIRALHSRGYGIEKVLIYGSGATGRRVFSVLKRSPKLGLEPIALVDDDSSKAGATVFEMGYERRRCAPVLKGPVNQELITRMGVDLVIVAIPSIGRERFARTVEDAFAAQARIYFVPSILYRRIRWSTIRTLMASYLRLWGGRSHWVIYEALKRVCDFAGSLILLTLGSPVFLLLSALIKSRLARHGSGKNGWARTVNFSKCISSVPCT